MPRGIKKANLPTKTCQCCGLAFVWRKKWQRDWEQVRYCSDRCRDGKNPTKVRQSNASAKM